MTTREIYAKIKENAGKREMILESVVRGERAGEKKLWYDKQAADEKSENVLYERIKGRDTLVICGAGHVSIPVIRIAKEIGFYTIVVDDRPKFANDARSAGADAVVCDNFQSALDHIEGSRDTYFVIVTRGHRYDMECLEKALKKEHAYVGMMGSRKRVLIVKEELGKKGFQPEILEKIHAPIGLDIGAQSPEEIAVSITAELIQERHNQALGCQIRQDILERLTQDSIPCIMLTIISKTGSAPQGVGTRMLVYEDGTCVGTIGGGCVESRLMRESLEMLRLDTPYKISRVNMTKEEAEEEGMVCGGTVEVFMELIR